jgi:hypothetical protein
MGFDLDPCGNSLNQNHLHFRTAEEIWTTQGLERKWIGRVWLNPPYGKDINRWMERMAGNPEGMALIFMRSDTIWFQDYVLPFASGLYFIRGRIKFFRPDGTESKNSGGAPSVLISYGGGMQARLRHIHFSQEIPGTFVDLRRFYKGPAANMFEGGAA